MFIEHCNRVYLSSRSKRNMTVRRGDTIHDTDSRPSYIKYLTVARHFAEILVGKINGKGYLIRVCGQ